MSEEPSHPYDGLLSPGYSLINAITRMKVDETSIYVGIYSGSENFGWNTHVVIGVPTEEAETSSEERKYRWWREDGVPPGRYSWKQHFTTKDEHGDYQQGHKGGPGWGHEEIWGSIVGDESHHMEDTEDGFKVRGECTWQVYISTRKWSTSDYWTNYKVTWWMDILRFREPLDYVPGVEVNFDKGVKVRYGLGRCDYSFEYPDAHDPKLQNCDDELQAVWKKGWEDIRLRVHNEALPLLTYSWATLPSTKVDASGAEMDGLS